jgi:hypothetical protein|eukprot:COSAG06_NODE_962_length_11309_cov_26.096075_3_plen_116_part_00
MMSFHSWVGMFSVLIFSAQLTAGAYHFLPGPDAGVPGVTKETKSRYLPLHITAGVLALVLPVATSGIGIMEKMGFVDKFGTDGFNLKKQGNMSGLPEADVLKKLGNGNYDHPGEC